MTDGQVFTNLAHVASKGDNRVRGHFVLEAVAGGYRGVYALCALSLSMGDFGYFLLLLFLPLKAKSLNLRSCLLYVKKVTAWAQ